MIYKNITSITYKKIKSGKGHKTVIKELTDMGFSKEEAEDTYEDTFINLLGWGLNYMRGKCTLIGR